MKYLIGIFILCISVGFAVKEDIYSISIKAIDGQTIPLSKYQGKKMMFVILPVSEEDTTIQVKELKHLMKQYDSSLLIVGVLAEEFGYSSKNNKKLKKLYEQATGNFILTEGMRVKKDSSQQQTALFRWLTDRKQNRHFQDDVRGVGHKFFVDETGELYGVMGPEIRLTHPVISRILSKPLPHAPIQKNVANGKPS